MFLHLLVYSHDLDFPFVIFLDILAQLARLVFS